jgi:hypothetical protein
MKAILWYANNLQLIATVFFANQGSVSLKNGSATSKTPLQSAGFSENVAIFGSAKEKHLQRKYYGIPSDT